MALHLSLHLNNALLIGLLTSEVELFDVHGIHLELCPGTLTCGDMHLSYKRITAGTKTISTFESI